MRGIHQGYFEAGSHIVETNTFGGTRLKLNEYQIGDRTRELNVKGARLARAVAPPDGYVAGSIGPTSRLPAEYGRWATRAPPTSEYFETFREQAEALAEGGVDLFAVETMMFPQEATAAIRACKAVADLPVMATMFFQYEELHDRDRTMWGESPAEVAKNLLAAGADIVGMNCGRGPDRAIVIIREMRAVTDAPLVAYPNAGLPDHQGRPREYELGPEEMARDYPALLDAGCNIVGACCGSNPEHIRRIAEVVRARSDVGPLVDDETPRVLSDIPLAIDPDEVLRFQGYKRGVDVPGPDVVALFEEALALGRRLMRAARRRSLAAGRGTRRTDCDVGRVTLDHCPASARAWGADRARGGGVVHHRRRAGAARGRAVGSARAARWPRCWTAWARGPWRASPNT